MGRRRERGIVHVDEERAGGALEQLEDLAQERRAILAVAELAQLRVGRPRDVDRPAPEPRERRVVQDDYRTVRRGSDVDLDELDAGGDCRADGRKSVLSE
jgi:hypothetical protein